MAVTGFVGPDHRCHARSWSGDGRARLAADLDATRAHVRAVEVRWADRLLTLAALLGLLVLAATVTASAMGLRPLVVRSGSMEPRIATGSMVLVRDVPATQLRVGDVVAVDLPGDVRVIHRVVAVEAADAGLTSLRLKGDANDDPDPAPVLVRRAGLLVGSAPGVGRAAAWLATAQGGFTMGLLVAGGVLVAVRRRRVVVTPPAWSTMEHAEGP